MDSLNKLSLNNKIVEMRQSVRQSRIHSISKLIKEIKKLKNKHGTDEQKAKSVGKAERLVQIVQIMKKLKDDDVSKFALLNEKSLVDVTNNVNETLENKALARFSNHRAIYEKVKSFREQYPNWKETIPALFETLGERHKDKKKIPKKSNVKHEQKRVDNSKKTNTVQSKVKYIRNTSGVWLVEEAKTSSEIGSKEFSEKIKTPAKILNNESANSVKEKQPPSEKKLAMIVPRTKKEEDVSAQTQPKKVDSFFMTKDNKEYLSVSVEERTDNITDNSTSLGNKWNKQNGNKLNKNVTTFGSGRDQKFRSNSFTKVKVEEVKPRSITLHPSWEAKRQQSNMVQFKGKKIKFDDD